MKSTAIVAAALSAVAIAANIATGVLSLLNRKHSGGLPEAQQGN